MSRLDDLIAEYCPDGVPFEPLRDLGNWYGGGTPSKHILEYWQGGSIPWLSPKDMGKPIIETTEDYITEAAVAGSATKLVPANSVALVVRSSILDRILPTALIPVPITLNQDMKAVVPREDVLPSYLAHLLRSLGRALLRAARKTGGSVASIEVSKLFSFRVPVPPLAIQREIASVLDKMECLKAELEAELEAELDSRSRQYAFYRDELMSFREAGDVRWAPMGELARVVRGASPRPIQAFLTADERGVPWIKIGDVPAGGKYITSTAQRVTIEGALKSRIVRPGDFVLSNSMSFGRPYISKIEGAIHDGWLAISHFSEFFLPDFLYHLLRSAPVQTEFTRRAGSSTVSNLNAEIVRDVPLPVPSLDEQKQISDLLDNFEILVNDLSIGLPAEIAARRVQYEYYRDRLLTFDETVAWSRTSM